MGADRYEKLRSAVVFRPDDIHNLEQIPKPNTKVPITEDGKTAMFRYPSPGSQEGGRQPEEDVGSLYEDPYKVAYYPRDTARRHQDSAFPNRELEEMKLALLPEDDEDVIAAKERFEEGPKSLRPRQRRDSPYDADGRAQEHGGDSAVALQAPHQPRASARRLPQ